MFFVIFYKKRPKLSIVPLEQNKKEEKFMDKIMFKELKDTELTNITGGTAVGVAIGHLLAGVVHYYGKTASKIHKSPING